MSLPSPARLLAAVDATWPAAEVVEREGWRMRHGGGGGKRVAAASALIPGEVPDPARAAEAAATWDQPALFRLGPGEEALDHALADRGARVVDPVVFYVAGAAALASLPHGPAKVLRASTDLAIMTEMWERAGIGEGRRRVMQRPVGPRIRLMARVGDRPAGVAFVASDAEVAMIHAIEVEEHLRRAGAGAALLQGAAAWAVEEGAVWLALAVTAANDPARALYAKLGMAERGGYHYRLWQAA